MRTLHIGTKERGGDFTLPLDLVTQTLAILAKKGAGKSYTASVVVENLLTNGRIPVILDPTGAWWGLKSSADGLAAGFPVVVFGGDHADLPLEENAGEALARAIVEQRFPAIIDLSLFRKGQVKRFVTPFLETIYRLNRQPLHLVVDEADDICPQKPFGDEAQMVGALEDVVKRGRKKGIGCTLITQRPADLAKQVLTQCEMLVAMRLTHPLDIKAVMEWINVHADPQAAADMVRSLPGLPIGTAWFWSPGWGDIFERVKVKKRLTFDSGATPKEGDPAVMRPKLAQIDIVKLGADITAAVQRAKDNDPKELRARIGKLELQLHEQRTVPAQTVTETVEIPVFGKEDRDVLVDMQQTVKFLSKQCDDLMQGIEARLKFPKWPTPAVRSVPAVVEPVRLVRAQPDALVSIRCDEDLPEGEKRILTAVAQHPDGCTREQLTVLTGYKKSSRDTYLQRMRAKDLVQETAGRIVATDQGVAALGSDYEPLPTGRALCDYWLAKLPQGEQRVLAVLVGFAGRECQREAITNQTGYKKSSRDTYLQRLMARELVQTDRKHVWASPILFES